MTIYSPTYDTSQTSTRTISELAISSSQPYTTKRLNGSGNHLIATRLLVTLKSSLQLLLVSPRNSGKLALLESMAHTLVGEPGQQYQVMAGHAYWASRSRNISLLVEAQSSFNAQKLLLLLEEVVQPKNADRLFIACLARISPAEVFNIFSRSGIQLFSGGESIPYPPNFRLIGTLDSPGFFLWEEGLLANTSVVEWPKRTAEFLPEHEISQPNLGASEPDFLNTCVQTEQKAYSKLIHLLGKKRPFPLLAQVNNLLNEHGIHLTRDATNKVIRFLANAWTEDGKGLFAPSVQANLNIALGCAITQYILPWARVANNKSSLLFTRLNRLLRSHGLEYAISPHD